MKMTDETTQSIPFKAETRQLLDILIHSLYTEREVFLRELISNASDALTRMSFEMLTTRELLDPEAELAIWITVDREEKTITIRDTGIGMTQAEMHENLGTIAHSGARAFIRAAEQGTNNLSDLIGQFGVGFYSAFMAADWIRVTSRSFHPESEAAVWYSTGSDTYTVEPGEKENRGTEVVIKLNADSEEFADEHRLRSIIKKHSDYIPFPIYLGYSSEQVNRQTAIWRQNPRQVEEKDYSEFYKQLTLEFEEPLTHVHLNIDAPVQIYALLYVPASSERNMFSLRRQDGVALYARKVLIQEYNKDLLPEYFRFVQGVIDSEDIPLNVSREAVQSSRVMGQLKKLITSKLIDAFKNLAKDKPDTYTKFWEQFRPFIKEGVSTDPDYSESLLPLLRYHTLHKPTEWVSLSDYVQSMQEGQQKIFYILGEDERSLVNSPHLEIFRRHGYDVLLMADPIDSFTLLRFTKYADFDLSNASADQLDLPAKEDEQEGVQEQERLLEEEVNQLIERFKTQLSARVTDVRTTTRLVESPARLVDPEGTLNPEMQRVYKMLNREFEMPQKVLELNPKHAILKRLSSLPADDPLNELVIEQVYEDALLIEGLHPDPASMINRIQRLLEAALK
jgi:HSP90 family molecular chaperone